MKNRLAVLIAATSLLLTLVSQGYTEQRKGKPPLVKDVFTHEEDKYSLEKQLNRDGFDDDGFTHNGNHYVSDPSAKTGATFNINFVHLMDGCFSSSRSITNNGIW